MRTATVARKTNETEIAVTVDLDGTGTYEVATGIGFLDHMLEQLSRHSLMDLTCNCILSLLLHFTWSLNYSSVFPLQLDYPPPLT